MKAEEIKAKARWFVEEINKGNVDAGDEVFASNLILHRPSFPDIGILNLSRKAGVRISN